MEGSSLVSIPCSDTLRDKVANAVNHVKKYSHPIILSYVFEIKEKDPLQIFSSFQSAYAGKRFYWATPDRTFILCGIGVELELTTDKKFSNRFFDIYSKWKDWKEHIQIEGAHPIGTGPLLFGGFSFDPLKNANPSKWKPFHEARFTLPSFMITKIGRHTLATINRLIQSTDDINEIINHFNTYEYTLKKKNEDTNSFLNFTIKKESLFYKKEWMAAVEKATEQIKQNRFEKVVLAREMLLEFEGSIDIHYVLSMLKKHQPNCYLFVVENEGKTFVGATPERLVSKRDQKVQSACVAGSIKRGKTVEADEEYAQMLLSDTKNIHEHQIVVKAIEKVFREYCQEVQLQNNPTILKTPNIQHLYTPVEGTVKKGFTLIDFVEKLHPTPALGGYPKDAALAFIRNEEPLERGWYAAPVGWMDDQDNGEFVVAIRSGLLDEQKAYLYAGCGIVGDSKPEEEYRETEIKFGPMQHALGGKLNEK